MGTSAVSPLVGKESSKGRLLLWCSSRAGTCVNTEKLIFTYVVSRAEMAHLSRLSPFSKSTTSGPSVSSHQPDPQAWVVGHAQVSAVLGNCFFSAVFQP